MNFGDLCALDDSGHSRPRRGEPGQVTPGILAGRTEATEA